MFSKKTAGFLAGTVLYGVAALFNGCASVNETVAPVSAPDDAFKTYVTKDTLQRLGWLANELPAWARMDVVVFGKEDLNLSETARAQMLHIAQYSTDRTYHDDLLKMAAMVRPFVHRFMKSFEGLERDGVAAAATDNLQKSLALRAAFQNEAASALSLTDANGNKKSFCFITLPPPNLSAIDFVDRLSEFPRGKFSRVSGEGMEWLALILAHEASHCRHRPDGLPEQITTDDLIVDETYADISGMNIYAGLAKEGRIKTPSLPDDMLAIRAIRTFLGRDISHSTSAGVFLERKSKQRRVTFFDDIFPMYHKIDEYIEKKHGIDYSFVGKFTLENPGVLYDAVAALETQGVFRDYPVERIFVSQFLEAAQKYAPEYFGIEKKNLSAAPAVQPLY